MRYLVKLSRRAGLAALVLAASACAAGPVVNLGPGPVPAEVRQLARRAHAGDADARLELARRFAAGDGVVADLERACRIVSGGRAANRDIWIYNPTSKQLDRYDGRAEPWSAARAALAREAALCAHRVPPNIVAR